MMKILKGNMGWHCDSTYMPVQAKGAVFSARVVPKSGGQTGWADMRAAYDAQNPCSDKRAAALMDKSKMKELVKLAKGDHLKLRYGIYTHAGDAAAGKVAEAYAAFAKMK